MAKELTKTEVKNIVSDELKKFIDKDLEKEVNALLSSPSTKTNKEIKNLIKDGLVSLYSFMWLKRNVWGGDITK